VDRRLLPERSEVGYCYSEKMGEDDFFALIVGEVQSVRVSNNDGSGMHLSIRRFNSYLLLDMHGND